MRIFVLTSSRADYGIYLPLLKKLKADPIFQLSIVAFGTHLSKEHGYTIDRIKKDGFEIAFTLNTMPEEESPYGISRSMGNTLQLFSNFWKENAANVDLIICLGDRYEMFSAVAASLPFNIKIAHFHGGETSLGAIDESFRHSLTAMSHLHFTSTEKSAQRVSAIKGSSKGVHHVGAMALDNIHEIKLLSKSEFKTEFGVEPNEPILVTFHPETVAFEKNEQYCDELIKALSNIQKQIFITLPNADTNGDQIRKKLLAFSSSAKNCHCFDSLGTQGYFSAIHFAFCLLGNTSSGIIEAASFGKHVINIGDRQKGREKGENVIDVEINAEKILHTIKSIEAKSGTQMSVNNIYGNGRSSEKVISLLKTYS